ncbi:MAG: DEAD/DEAH box helicase family protein [Clostridia bacterium]|nr:DEAD/DEAH box helicase family protein [Clostridia bacterium]
MDDDKNNKNGGKKDRISYSDFVDLLLGSVVFSDNSSEYSEEAEYVDDGAEKEEYAEEDEFEGDEFDDYDDEDEDDDYGPFGDIFGFRREQTTKNSAPQKQTWWERLEEERRERERKAEEAKLKKQQEKEERERIKREKWEAHVNEVTCMDMPLTYVNPYSHDFRAYGVHAESADDGLILSISNLGRVDIEYISEITGLDFKEILSSLKGQIFQNPEKWDECFYKAWESADEYLTGNLQTKLDAALAADDKYLGYFSSNVEALKRVMPPKVPAADIYVTLGSPWVPSDVIQDFLYYLFDKKYPVSRDPYTGTWEISYYTYFYSDARLFETYGTKRLNALEIIELTLNMKNPTVYNEVYNKERGTYTQIINKDETVQALDRQKLLIDTFRRWVWEDGTRRARLEDIYNRKYCAIRKRTFDGSLLHFPGMSSDVSLYDYQKCAVSRILYSPNTLLAHEVGAGKTFIMVAAGMELRRMGLSEKNMYVVPNNIVAQWADIFKKIYPLADILVISSKDFTPKTRDNTLLKMRDEDHDAIIIPYSCFERIPVSVKFQKEQLDEQLDKISSVPATVASSKLRRRQTALTKKRDKLAGQKDDKKTIYFDGLGVTRLFVDEAHNYKNLAVDTNIDGVLGISTLGSAKCTDMLNKVRLVQKKNGGGGVVLATGTPLTNSVVETFVMQTYLQPDELEYGLTQNFDSWAGMFGEKVTEFEVDVDTSGYRLATRFSRFHNLPELTSELALIADFHSPETSDGVPVTDGYTDVLIPKTKEFADFLKLISVRADNVRNKRVDRKVDNMLLITTDGRLAALDLRLKVPASPETEDCKVRRCAERVFEIYKNYSFMRGTQLVFCDTSTPKEKFNIYDELKRILLSFGVPASEIAYIHDAQTDEVRLKLFEKVRRGDVRILIGSTFKMGLGMNVQDRLVAIHHTDIPWRPADMVQREGRILRPGNMNEKVFIFRYITEGSFDAYSWQILESKQRFISEILSGSYGARSGEDIKDSVLNYAEVKALAVGNPLIKKRVEKANELATYLTLKRKYEENRADLTQELSELPEQIAADKLRIENCEADINMYAGVMKEFDGLDEWKAERQKLAAERKAKRVAEAAAEKDKTEGDVSIEADAKSPEENKTAMDELLAASPDVSDATQSSDEEEVSAELLEIEEKGLSPEEKARNKKFIALDNKVIAEHREARGKISEKIFETNFHYKEESVCSYRGFEIVIPAGMENTKPYVWLKGAGKYYVELGVKQMGYMTRIDNFLDTLDAVLKNYYQRYDEKTKKKSSIEFELSNVKNYDRTIAALKEELDDIDRQLGLDEEE